MIPATRQQTDMVAWPPGARHYLADDGRSFAVLAQSELSEQVKAIVNDVLEAVGEMPLTAPLARHKVALRPSVIIECEQDGGMIDMTPWHRSPAGTPYEDTLLEAGYEVH